MSWYSQAQSKRQKMASVGVTGDVIVFGFCGPYWLMVLSVIVVLTKPFIRPRAVVGRPGSIQIWQMDSIRSEPVRCLAQIDSPTITLEQRTRDFDKLRINGSVFFAVGQTQDVDRLLRVAQMASTGDSWGSAPDTNVPRSRVINNCLFQALSVGLLAVFGLAVLALVVFTVMGQ